MKPLRFLLCLAVMGVVSLPPIAAQESAPVTADGDWLSIRLVDVDLRGAVQALGRHLDRPVVFGGLGDARVTLETPAPVRRREVVHLLRGVLESHNLELVVDSGFYRVRGRRGAHEPYGANGEAPPTGDVQLFVIRLRHARAADVAGVVNALYGRASALGELGARPPTLSEGLRQQRVPPIDAPVTDGHPVIGGSAALSGEITIVPDARTNSLLVRATYGDFGLIRAAVEQVDIRPLQVLIEVLIAEVRRDRGFAFGLDATLPPVHVPGTTDTRIDGSTTGLGLGDFALRVMSLGGVDLDVTLRAAAARGDVSIISRPVLLAANDERAQILVGSQRPFIQVQRALPTDAPLRDQVVQYKDVGTQLTVRPTISANGYVMLEVSQEVNAATTETAFDAPVISTRSVQTQLLVRDGQTAVLGGLSDRQRDVSHAGVPFLSNLPLIGALFGRTSRRTVETELFVFLTPRVIRTDEELDEAAREAREGSPLVDSRLGRLGPAGDIEHRRPTEPEPVDRDNAEPQEP
jgi:type II secretory pathway component GspD/PulD (secretin)